MTRAKAESKSPAGDPNPDSLASFETSLTRLNEIVERLESSELNLEESLGLFEEGVRLARASQARLDAAEKRVEELLAIDEQGEPVVREIDVD
ncbi:MAG TPA: exodeoxyribonuclease VII small subunit [Polyangiaceae bacterium]|jgi:exodeoxyribonuclease VII small subunit